MNTVQELIEKAIEKAGSQQKLAELIGTTQVTISHWLTGKHWPHGSSVIKIEQYIKEETHGNNTGNNARRFIERSPA